jgi:glycosyltransferase Alg8
MASTTKSRLGRLSHLQPGLNFSLLILLMLAASIGLLWLRQGNIDSVYLSEIFTLGTIGLWRWSWFGLQTVRSRLYEHVLFPQSKRHPN